MKYLYILLLFCLLHTHAFTQNSDLSCPKVEWMKGIQNNTAYGIILDAKKNNNIKIAFEFTNNLNIDSFNITNNHGRLTLAFMESDESGNIAWLKTSNGSGRSLHQHQNKLLVTKENESNIIMMHNQATTFNNQNYSSTITNQPGLPLQYNGDYTLIKIDTNKQTINNFFVQNLKLQNVITDSLGFSYVIATYNSTINIANQTFVPLGQHDAIVIKLDRQYQVQWVLPISGKGNEEFVNITLDKNLNVYIAGHFNSDTLQIGNEIIIDTARTNINSYSGYNILFSKINNNGILQWANHTHATRNTAAKAQQIIVDSNNNVFILASLAGSLVLNNTNFESSRVNNVGSYIQNTTIIKYNPNNYQYNALNYKATGHNYGRDMILNKSNKEIYLVGYYTDTLFSFNGFLIADHIKGFLSIIDIEHEKMNIKSIIECTTEKSTITSITESIDGTIYIAGYYTDSLNILNYSLPNSFGNFLFYAKISGLNKEITYDGSMYTATETQATTYQWLDCNNNMQAIPGANSRTYTPSNTGSYAVELSNGTCQVVSECLGTTSLPKTILAQTQIFPNPFDQSISIQVPPTLALQELHLQVTDLLGRTIWSHKGNAKELNTQLQEKSKLWPSNQMYHCTITLSKTQERKSIKIYKQ